MPFYVGKSVLPLTVYQGFKRSGSSGSFEKQSLKRLAVPMRVAEDDEGVSGMVSGEWLMNQTRALNRVIQLSGRQTSLDSVAQRAADETAMALYSVTGSQRDFLYRS